MNTFYDIYWLPVRDIPNQHGYNNLTVKRQDGELINTVVLHDRSTQAHYLRGVTLDEIKGWIPNEK